jgi:hypothetical protein
MGFCFSCERNPHESFVYVKVKFENEGEPMTFNVANEKSPWERFVGLQIVETWGALDRMPKIITSCT